MEGQEYLNQISAENRPAKKTRVGDFALKILKVILIGVVGLIIVLIINSIITGVRSSEKELNFKLQLHIDNTAKVISDYQPDVKSSNLRSSSASLYSVLSNTSRELTNYLNERYEKNKNASKDLKEEAETAKDELEVELFEAKINGNLDRIYAHKMAYEISLIMNEETKLIKTTGNDTLKGILEASYGSLENLYNNFNNFSEAK